MDSLVNKPEDLKNGVNSTVVLQNISKQDISTVYEVNPNPAKYIDSLRNSETNNIAAIEDIVDNSIDAGASVISISTKWNKVSKKYKKSNEEQFDGGPISIIISDNGTGMNKERLLEGLKLGSMSTKTSADIGIFGCGMKESIISFARQFTIYTRNGDGVILVATFDVDHIIKTNKFEVDIHEANFMEKRFFESELEKMDNVAKDIKVASNSSGTVIKIEKIDRFTWKQEKSFINALTSFNVSQSRKAISSMAEVYRIYLRNENIRIFVNGVAVKAYDPIRYNKLVSPLAEENIQLPEGCISFTIAEIDTEDTGESRDIGIGFFSRGFYIMRNDRQIMAAEDLGVLPNKNNVNNLRIEMRFSPEMDGFFQTSRYKNNILVNEELKSRIGTLIAPFIKRVASNNLKKARLRKTEKLDTSKAEKRISQKAHLLKAIKGLKKEKRDSRVPHNESNKDKETRTHYNRENIKKVQRVISGTEKAEFLSYDGGKKGPMFEPEFTNNNKIRISLNRDHPIYSLLNLEEGSELLDPTLFVFYCLGRQELNARDDHNNGIFEAIENLRWDIGRDMSTLLLD